MLHIYRLDYECLMEKENNKNPLQKTVSFLQQNKKHCNLHLHEHECSTDKCVKKIRVNFKHFVYTAMLNFISVPP